MSFTGSVDIIAETLEMLPPRLSEGIVSRQSRIPGHEALISKETFLRKTAYRNAVIHTSEAFFDDSDLQSPYYLLVVYDKISGTPLLSARYYFDKTMIDKCLAGDVDGGIIQSHQENKICLSDYNDAEIFLADRLSGNLNSAMYRQYRQQIFSLFYAEIVKHNKHCSLILMVRQVRHNKQLLKYLRLGFVLAGSVVHKGKVHSIIICDLKKI